MSGDTSPIQTFLVLPTSNKPARLLNPMTLFLHFPSVSCSPLSSSVNSRMSIGVCEQQSDWQRRLKDGLYICIYISAPVH